MEAEPAAKRLLIADDNEGIKALICQIAEAADFVTHTTASAAELIALAVDWQPSFVIMDLQLPNSDGIQTLKSMAREGCDCNVIITSGLDVRVLEAAAKIAAENGLRISGVLAKPFSEAQLQALLICPLSEAPRGLNKSAVLDTRISSSEFMEMSRALDACQFVPYFQPKIDCATRAPSGFECLARWLHPKRGMVMPDDFIPLAERSGLIHRLSHQIFEQALQWFSANVPNDYISLALNMSPKLLCDNGFSLWLEELCERYGVAPRRITLEITETSAIGSQVELLEYLTLLRIKGFHLSIDDFGVGHSSLTQLARLPFSEMKIDKGFIMNAARSQESQKIAVALVGLAGSLGLSITAEGVEEEWTLDYLRQIGCDRAQGYFIARPLDPQAALAWLKRQQAVAV